MAKVEKWNSLESGEQHDFAVLVVLETNDLSILRFYREEIARLVRDAKPGGYYTLPIDYRRK